MKISQISVPYETLHAVYRYFSLENTKGRNRPVTSSVNGIRCLPLFSPENPTTENRRVTRPFSSLFSELELRQYETVDQSAGDFAF